MEFLMYKVYVTLNFKSLINVEQDKLPNSEIGTKYLWLHIIYVPHTVEPLFNILWFEVFLQVTFSLSDMRLIISVLDFLNFKIYIREPIGLWDIGVPKFSKQSAHIWQWGCQPYMPATLHPPVTFFLLIPPPPPPKDHVI
jgi:hypothetical protein